MAPAPLDIAHFRTWISREEVTTDIISPFPIAGINATLDYDLPRPQTGDEIPTLAHWFYCLPAYRQSSLGSDGHAQRGGFLPPVPLERRMWAGGRFNFHQPLRVGETIERRSTVADVTLKEGRTGSLVFVLVKHTVSGPQGLAISEEHDIVYRDAPKLDEPAAAPKRAPTGAIWRRDIQPDDTLLFRYSALTFNSHRIHYDRRYVTQVEGYPGLIVHGPLIATLLTDLVRRNAKACIASFRFRAVRPLFDTAPFAVCGIPNGSKVSLWAQDADGFLATEAEVELA